LDEDSPLAEGQKVRGQPSQEVRNGKVSRTYAQDLRPGIFQRPVSSGLVLWLWIGKFFCLVDVDSGRKRKVINESLGIWLPLGNYQLSILGALAKASLSCSGRISNF
jgi:hypothetical protein